MKHRILLYQRLLAGDSDLLAQDQPSPDEHALSLPTTIVLRPKIGVIWPASLLVFITLLLTGLALWSFVMFVTTPSDAFPADDDLTLAVTAGGLALFGGVCSWFLWRRLHFWVKVTETGLEAWFHGRRMQIAWEDARIFSVGGVIGPEQARIYTLVGEQGSVIWTQLMSESQARFSRPVLPFELYQQQSQALLEVIASRTNLSLYDMRLPANTWYL